MNRLSLDLAMHPRMDLILRCEICEQPIDPQDQTELQIKLFGLGPGNYGLCIGCLQEVEPPFKRDYKTRWGRRHRAMHAHPVMEHKRKKP